MNVVGHELRTPLTTIRGLAELLGDASEEELRETLIPALVRNARRAERLLDDLLIAGEIDVARPTVVYCAGGYRSSVAASLLRQKGFVDVSDLLGGYGAWTETVQSA